MDEGPGNPIVIAKIPEKERRLTIENSVLKKYSTRSVAVIKAKYPT
jgi:hypothetical protein